MLRGLPVMASLEFALRAAAGWFANQPWPGFLPFFMSNDLFLHNSLSHCDLGALSIKTRLGLHSPGLAKLALLSTGQLPSPLRTYS